MKNVKPSNWRPVRAAEVSVHVANGLLAVYFLFGGMVSLNIYLDGLTLSHSQRFGFGMRAIWYILTGVALAVSRVPSSKWAAYLDLLYVAGIVSSITATLNFLKTWLQHGGYAIEWIALTSIILVSVGCWTLDVITVELNIPE